MEFLKGDFKASIENMCKNFSGGVKMNFFELLHTPYGFDALQSWFFNQCGSDIDEYGLWKILNGISEKVTETGSWEIFDTLAHEVTISFKEFCMIIFLFAAAETGQLKLLLYMHGKKLYQQLSGGEKQDICFERIKRIGRILGINERYLITKGREFSIVCSKNPLNFDHFQLYYFKIFSEIDYVEPKEPEKPDVPLISRPESIVPIPLPQEKKIIKPALPHINKKKSSCTGCKSKACILL